MSEALDEFRDRIDAGYDAAFEFEERLATVIERSLRRSARYASDHFSQEILAAAWTPPLTDPLVRGMNEEEQGEAADLVERAVDAFLLAAAAVLVGFAAVEFYQSVAQRRVSLVQLTLEEKITQIVQVAYESGLSASETAQLLRREIQGLAPVTAQMIAESELTTVANERSLAVARDRQAGMTGPLYKVWQTRQDPRVRPAHALAQGQTVPIDGSFSVGGFQMMYPGDPAAPLTLTARCRCVLGYTDSLTASGWTPLGEGWIASTEEVRDMTTLYEQLTAGVTITITESGEEEGSEERGEPVAWRALLAVENQPTEDGRMIAEGALDWRDLPLSLMALDETGPGGHEGARVAGRIDRIERNELEVWGSGVFDSGEFGQQIARMVGEQTLRGNSVDLAVLDWEYWDAETMEPIGDDVDLMDVLFGDAELLFVVTEGVILASTVVPTPAIAGAEIMLASGLPAPLMRMAWTQDPRQQFAASGSTSLPLSDRERPWSASAARRSLSDSQFGSAHFWRDPEGEPDQIGSYKLPFAQVIDGRLTAVWRGVTAAAQRLGQTDMPSSDVAGVRSRIGAYYAKARRQYDDDTIEVPWAAEEEELTASAAGLAPLKPPAAWFDDPVLDGPTPMTVEGSGRVYGHLALFNTCHIGEPRGPGICTPPPRSGMGYDIFHHGAVVTEEGSEIPVGVITLGTTHAGRGNGWSGAMKHYEHTGLCVADVRAGEDRYGIWIAGALRPDIPESKVREFRAGSLSGDWRQVIGRGLELIAALVVNVPGFPIPRPEARIVASAAGEEEVLALVAAGIVPPEEEIETEPVMTVREYIRQRGVLTREPNDATV
jgi:hypothetical protein